MPSLAINLVLSTLMSRLYLRLTQSRRSTSSCSSLSEMANRIMSLAYWRFVTIRPPICSPPCNLSRVSLITVSARMLNKCGEKTQPCRTPFLTRNHSDSVPATLLWLFHIFCSDAPIACRLFNLVSNSVVHSPSSVIRT